MKSGFAAEQMKTPLHKKSSISDIERRFDSDVERFSNLDAGQAATVDAPLAMELISEAAVAATPVIAKVLDIGCGAGNNTIKLLRKCGKDFDSDLIDLSRPMLERAKKRVSQETRGAINIFHGDFRAVKLTDQSYDVIIAAAVLHHLRDDQDWKDAFAKIYRLLKPGGSFWVTDLVSHENAAIHQLMWNRYGDYLQSSGGEDYKKQVFTYIDQEDSPRSVTFQLDLMRASGFVSVDVLHKNSCFSAFGAIKGKLVGAPEA